LFTRVTRFVLLAAVLVLGSLAANQGVVSAYGRAEHPLAQLELSGNCNNPAYPLCFPPPTGFGLGGIWLWIEIDAGGSGDVAGAGCGHVRGVGGGAGPIKGEITWQYATLAQATAANAFVVGIDPNNSYYVVTIAPGEVFAFPTTQGHYSFHPAPAVAQEAQVAP
jgi:hypothetical protein